MPTEPTTAPAAGPHTARLGLGAAAVGRPGYINLGREADLPAERTVEALRERTHALLDAAYAAGVRYLDTARSYGRAEEPIGRRRHHSGAATGELASFTSFSDAWGAWKVFEVHKRPGE